MLVGKFDGDRLRGYLRKLSSSVESYGPTDIYTIPLEGRTVRVAILGVNTVAASNHTDPLVIRGIIDRSRKLASPFGGPALLRQYYKTRSAGKSGMVDLQGVSIFERDQPCSCCSDQSFVPFFEATVVVASIRYLGAIHLRAEAFTASEEDARQAAEKLKTFLAIFNSAEISLSGQRARSRRKAVFQQPESRATQRSRGVDGDSAAGFHSQGRGRSAE